MGRLIGQRYRQPPSLILAVLAVVVATLLIGSSTFIQSSTMLYGRFDDYLWVYDNLVGGTKTHVAAWVDSGRLVPALLADSLGATPDSVSDLAALRALTVSLLCLGSACFGILLLRLTRRWDLRVVLLAIVISCAVLVTPSIPAIATWAVLAGSSAAFALALVAGLVATLPRTPLLPWWFWSGVLIALAAFTYQHVAPIALLPVLLWNAESWAKSRRRDFRRSLFVGIAVLCALASNFVYLHWVGSSSLARVDGSTTAQRVHWFISEFLPRTVDLTVPWSGRGVGLSAVLLALLLASPVLVAPRFLSLSIGVIFSWLFTAAFVIPTELWASHRLVSAAQSVLWGGAAVVLGYVLASLSGSRVFSIVGTLALITVVTAGLVNNGHRAYEYLALPNARDWAAALCTVERRGPVDPDEPLVLTPYVNSGSAVLSYDEYGMVSSSYDWSFPYTLVLAESQVFPSSVRPEEGYPATLKLADPDSGRMPYINHEACENVP